LSLVDEPQMDRRTFVIEPKFLGVPLQRAADKW